MPMYRYVCSKCGNEELHLHGINDTPSIKCSKCGGDMFKGISKVGIVFKGNGYYITDSRNNSKTESKSSEKVESAAK
ncbi:MAG TPA: zinc ribbon domain-containing protein [Fervidobacterium sp.]|nr:FmdB family transcriptional regulator [Fervidobacterium sp.]NLH36699.1 FmdB family transcriptional regulator [Thermotogaceae bacterium]HOH53690.1 zinc ribbon domain-containing protein [Fervidobacterium sp.]HOL04276.1 zinc ribbon domain-containing protein [Fervidobacterium sp.]HON04604.1 zinc ribbon domain-containing protein [Fervidobacterium sp.]